MDYLTLKVRKKHEYSTKTVLSYLFKKKQTHKQANKIFYYTIANCLQEAKYPDG